MVGTEAETGPNAIPVRAGTGHGVLHSSRLARSRVPCIVRAFDPYQTHHAGCGFLVFCVSRLGAPLGWPKSGGLGWCCCRELNSAIAQTSQMTGTDRDCECNGLFSSAMSIDVMLIGNRVQDLGYAIGRSIELPV